MGKRKGGGPSNKVAKQSSGNRKAARAKKALVRLKMKINRWKKYKAEDKKAAKGSSRTGWDTSGLEKHAEFLQSLI